MRTMVLICLRPSGHQLAPLRVATARRLVYYWVGRLLVIAFCFWLLVRGWLWLCYRYPRTMWFVLGFIRGLIGRRR